MTGGRETDPQAQRKDVAVALAARGRTALTALAAAVSGVVVSMLAGCGPATVAGAAAGHASPTARHAASPAARPAASPAPRAPAVPSGDGPSGFWYGTDSRYVATPGPAPFSEPAIGGGYGGYIGMLGNWADWQGCGGTVVWSPTDSAAARTNFVTYHAGIGVGGYWFMAGPGVDPHYNGTTAEATAWGAAQAAQALADLSRTPTPVNYPVIFMDVELPGDAPDYTPAPDNGWNAVYTSPCSGQVLRSYMPPSVSRADFDGFAAYLTSHSSYQAGVYSAPSIWASIFGTGPSANIPDTYEWTYNGLTSSLDSHPDGWCLSGTWTCAQFFGGQTSSSPYALMWQWSGGGGTSNGYGDFDQVDANRTP